MAPATQRAETSGLTLAEVYQEHAAFVWRTIRYLGVPHADAEDVAHEVFIIVQRRLGEYDPNHRLRSWVVGITRNVVMHYKRSRARSDRKVAALAAPVDAPSGPGPDEVISRQEAYASLEAFLAELDADRRDVFVLCELQELTAPEAARVLEVGVNTVYSRLRTARQLFQKRVDRIDRVRRREGG